MRVLWLAQVLRAAGVPVVEVPGWQSLGWDDWNPSGVIFHATADKARTAEGDRLDDPGAIGVIRNGRVGLAGPIANAYVNRQGVWYVIASGRCNTVKVGWGGPLNGWGNTRVLGVEAENDNKGEPWPEVQLDSLRAGFAAIMRKLDIPAARLAAHFEHQPGDKTDPHGIKISSFRADVARILSGASAPTGDDVAQGDNIWNLLDKGKRAPGQNQTTDGGKPASWIGREFYDLRQGQAAARLQLEAVLAALQGLDGSAILARVDQRAAELAEQVEQVPGETLEALRLTESLQEVADMLRELFGDERAQQVGVLLATGVEPVPAS